MSSAIPGLAGLAGGVAPSVAAPAELQCFSGVVQRRPEIGIPFAGTHLLTGSSGNVVASLVSSQVNLDSLVGQNATVCGFSQGVIEGVPAVAVTQVPAGGVAQPRLTGLFACTAGVLAPGPLFFAASPVNATLRTGSGDILLIVPGAAPDTLSPLVGQLVLTCGFLTVNNELLTIVVVPLAQLLGGGFPV